MTFLNDRDRVYINVRARHLGTVILVEAIKVAYGAKVVEETKHYTTVGQLYEHVHKLLAQLALAAPAKVGAEVGEDQRDVVQQGDHSVAALVSLQVVGDH